MSKIILGFTGPIASGKDVSKKYLIEKYGASAFRFSTVMRDLLVRLGLEINRYNLSHLSTSLRQTFGEDLFARTVARDVRGAETDLIVVDGIRRLADIEHLKDIPGFHLVAIDADPRVRFERLVTRNENVGDNTKTFEQFQRDASELETEISIPIVMEQAALKIDNSTSFAALYAQIDKIIADIKNKL